MEAYTKLAAAGALEVQRDPILDSDPFDYGVFLVPSEFQFVVCGSDWIQQTDVVRVLSVAAVALVLFK